MRKELKASVKDMAAAQKKEDEYWREAGEGKMTKAQQKKADKAAQRDDAVMKKMEARELLDRENDELARANKKPEKWKYNKVTAHELLMDKVSRNFR